MEKFTAPAPWEPPPFSKIGFGAGPITIAWAGDSYEIKDRGRVHTAEILRIETRTESLPRDVINAALLNLVVYADDGTLSRITGVESHCTIALARGAKIGLLLVPLDPAV